MKHLGQNLWPTLGLLFAFSLTAAAQTGTIRGVVQDPTGAVVAGATVTARNTSTGAERSVPSGSSGAYAIPSLVPGSYQVTAQSTGFNDARYSDLVLTVDQVLSLTIKFEKLGSTGQVLDVRADVNPVVDTETSQVSNIVDSKTLTDLPLILRDPYSLVLLSPGTVQSNSGLGGFSVNGSRERNNNFLLDGADNNDTSVPGIPSGLLVANPDSTEEFRVITNNFSPEFGRNTGAIIDVVTKSGTNNLHGDAYWFGRYNYFGARDYFNTAEATGKQNPYVRNTFGGSIGGPIIKNKTFFFFNGDYERFRTTVNSSATVPTAAFKSGIFQVQDDAGNPYTVDLTSPSSPNNLFGLPLDPTIASVFSKYPTPNGGNLDPLRGILFFASSSKFNQSAYTVKLDHNLTSKQTLSFRAAYNISSDPNPFFDDFLPGIGNVASKVNAIGFTAGLTSTLSNTIVNQFRAGFNRTNLPFLCSNLSTINSVSALDAFGRGRDYGFDGVTGWGCGVLGDSNGQSRRTGTYSLNDGLTIAKANHTIKFGAEFRFVFEDGYDSFSSREAIGFNPVSTFGTNIVDFAPGVTCNGAGVGCFNNNINNQIAQDLSGALLGLVTDQFQSQYFNKASTRTADDYRRFRQRESGVYFQDSWKFRPNLTLNYGVRYQLNGIPYERDGNLSNLYTDASGFAPFTFQLASHGLYNQDYKNIEPRVGFAWDPYKNGKTSIRGGYGIFHDRIFGNLFGNARGNPPFQRDQTQNPFNVLSAVPLLPSATPTATISDIDPLTGGPWLSAPVTFDSNLKIPYSQNWNIGIQREIAPNLSLEVNYVASHGTRQLRTVDGNPPQPNLIAQLVANANGDQNILGELQFGTLRLGRFFCVNFDFLCEAYPVAAVNNTAFSSVALNKSIGNSTYNSLQINLQKRFSHGVDIGAAYTWSHGIDDANDPLVAAGSGGRSFPRNSFNLREERGSSGFDIRQRAVIHYTFELPFGHGKKYLSDGVIGKVMEGWQVSGITSAQTGFPVDVFGNRDTEHTGLSSRLDFIGGPKVADDSAGLPQTGPYASQFAFAPFGRPGDATRNTFRGPGFVSSDLVASKTTILTEKLKLQLRAEGYNIFNHPNFSGPDNLLQDGSFFGHSTSTVGRADGTTGARQMQFALKLIF